MLSRLILRLRGLIVVALVIMLLGLNVSFSPIAQAANSTTYNGPALRLPWIFGDYTVAGYSYNCGDHVNHDQFALDFGLINFSISAVYNGTVHIGAFDPNGYGNNLWVSSGKYRAIYAHLSSIAVREGQHVT